MHYAIVNCHISQTVHLRLKRTEMVLHTAHSLCMMVLHRHIGIPEKKFGMDFPPSYKKLIYIKSSRGSAFPKKYVSSAISSASNKQIQLKKWLNLFQLARNGFHPDSTHSCTVLLTVIRDPSHFSLCLT